MVPRCNRAAGPWLSFSQYSVLHSAFQGHVGTLPGVLAQVPTLEIIVSINHSTLHGFESRGEECVTDMASDPNTWRKSRQPLIGQNPS